MELDTTAVPRRAWADSRAWLLRSFIAWVIVILAVGVASGIYLPIPEMDIVYFRILSGFIGAALTLVVILFITYTVHLFITPYRQRDEVKKIYLESQNKIAELESKELELVVNENDPNYVMVSGSRYKLRVGIRVKGKRSIHNVQVDLYKIDNNRTAHANPQLFPSESQGILEPYFDVNPSEDVDKFVDILSWDQGEEFLRLHYFKNYKIRWEIDSTPNLSQAQILSKISAEIPRPITASRHVLTLRLSGNDCNEVFQNVIIDIINNKLSLKLA